MFWHNLRYEILLCWRNKSFLFWLVLFPVLLGAFFKIAFSDIYEKETVFHTVPIAVVQHDANETLTAVIDSVAEGEDALFSVTKCSEDEALALLDASEISGIIHADDLHMTVLSTGIEQTIIKSFLEQYKMRETLLLSIAKEHPEQMAKAADVLQKDIHCNENIPLTDGNMDTYVQYFYNLIAMVALYGSITGLGIALDNQANFSAVGARKNCSSANKFIVILTALCGRCIAQICCTILSVSYITFILDVDFGNRLPFVYLAGCVASCTGVAMGFFIGSFGRMKENVKNAIALAFTMICCFLSGLMVINIKIEIAQNAPWVNKLNPAAVISDSLYCLNVYDDFSMYIEKVITLLIMTAFFILGGFLLIRRRKYASL